MHGYFSNFGIGNACNGVANSFVDSEKTVVDFTCSDTCSVDMTGYRDVSGCIDPCIDDCMNESIRDSDGPSIKNADYLATPGSSPL